MRRFLVEVNKGEKHTFALVRTFKGKYRFVNLTADLLLVQKFKTPAKALDWLDKYFPKYKEISKIEIGEPSYE